MTFTSRFASRFGVAIAVTSLIVSATARQAIAQANQLSDELMITGPGGAPVIYDALLPEGGGPGAEGSLLFSGGALPPILPPGALGGLIGGGALPGVTYVILTEEPGFVPDPLEAPPPVWIGPGNQDFFVSDVLVNGLLNQAGLPPFVALVSDNNPDLQQLVPLLPPTTPFLAETGLLQDLTPLLGPGALLPGFGPVEVRVRSDIGVPEPSTVVLAVLGGLALLAWRRRR